TTATATDITATENQFPTLALPFGSPSWAPVHERWGLFLFGSTKKNPQAFGLGAICQSRDGGPDQLTPEEEGTQRSRGDFLVKRGFCSGLQATLFIRWGAARKDGGLRRH